MSTARTIVITGVSRGLGRALLERFVEGGHRVAGCARSEDALQALETDVGGQAALRALDVTSFDAVAEWARYVESEIGVPDLIVNNAALMNDPAPLWEVPAREFDQLLAVNVGGVANVVRAFAPEMVRAKRGVLVHLSSGWGRSTSADVGPYCTTKWAVEGFASALAQDLPPGLASIALNPGIIDTEMLRQCWSEAAAAYEDAASWSERAAPFLLQLGAQHNGQALTVP